MLLEVDGLAVCDREEQLLSCVSFAVDRGECVALVGESGSGKSLITWSILGLLPRHLSVAGRIAIDGALVTTAIRASKVGFIPEQPHHSFDPRIRIGRQIGRSAQEARTLLQSVQVDAFDLYPHQLSGGMIQRAAIAAALASRPALLIADEPTSALDRNLRSEIRTLLRDSVRGLNAALLLITHDSEEAKFFDARTIEIVDGRVVSC